MEKLCRRLRKKRGPSPAALQDEEDDSSDEEELADDASSAATLWDAEDVLDLMRQQPLVMAGATTWPDVYEKFFVGKYTEAQMYYKIMTIKRVKEGRCPIIVVSSAPTESTRSSMEPNGFDAVNAVLRRIYSLILFEPSPPDEWVHGLLILEYDVYPDLRNLLTKHGCYLLPLQPKKDSLRGGNFTRRVRPLWWKPADPKSARLEASKADEQPDSKADGQPDSKTTKGGTAGLCCSNIRLPGIHGEKAIESILMTSHLDSGNTALPDFRIIVPGCNVSLLTISMAYSLQQAVILCEIKYYRSYEGYSNFELSRFNKDMAQLLRGTIHTFCILSDAYVYAQYLRGETSEGTKV